MTGQNRVRWEFQADREKKAESKRCHVAAEVVICGTGKLQSSGDTQINENGLIQDIRASQKYIGIIVITVL